jgi:pyruvate/2-oxoglutarate dehydrogenase complex dihydrolipoamide acyltransferase (E2) component
MSDVHAIIVPRKNVNDDEAVIIKWYKSSGDFIRTGDDIVELETTKTLFTMSAEYDGYLFYKIPEQSNVKVGIAIAYICEDNVIPDALTKAGEQNDLISDTDSSQRSVSLKAKKLMYEHGLSEHDFQGLTKIKVSDVEKKIKQMQHVLSSNVNEPVKSEIFEQEHSKQFEIRLLTESVKNTIPSFVSIAIDKKAVEREIESLLPGKSEHVSIGEYITFKTAKVLRQFPVLNGYYRQGKAHLYSSINIGFAINIGKGLKVPVIKQADEKSLSEISNLIKDFSLKYMRDELAVEDIQGGTFTVTDLSLFDVTHFVPVINYMQSAILGICSTLPQNSYFNVVLAFDHHLADGMVAAQMLKELKDVVGDQ